MFSAAVNISKVFGQLKFRGNSKVKKLHLGHSNNLDHILFWHHGAATQVNCIALTPIIHFKCHTFMVSKRAHGSRNSFHCQRWSKTSLNRKTRNITPIISSQLDTDACTTTGQFSLLSPTCPTCKVKGIYYFLRQLQVLHRHSFPWWRKLSQITLPCFHHCL